MDESLFVLKMEYTYSNIKKGLSLHLFHNSDHRRELIRYLFVNYFVTILIAFLICFFIKEVLQYKDYYVITVIVFFTIYGFSLPFYELSKEAKKIRKNSDIENVTFLFFDDYYEVIAEKKSMRKITKYVYTLENIPFIRIMKIKNDFMIFAANNYNCFTFNQSDFSDNKLNDFLNFIEMKTQTPIINMDAHKSFAYDPYQLSDMKPFSTVEIKKD